jgi:hypothetical protein
MIPFHAIIGSAFVVLLTLAQPAATQIRVTPVVGVYHPARSLTESGALRGQDGSIVAHYTMRRSSGPLAGVRAASDFGPRFGVEASLQLAMTTLRAVVTPRTPEYPGGGGREHVLLAGFRGVAHLNPARDVFHARLYAGPALLAFSDYWLALDRFHVAGTVGGGVAYAVTRRIELTGDIESYIYPDNDGGRWQNDLVLMVGFRLRPGIGR